MNLEQLMSLLESLYNSNGGEVEVLIGDSDIEARTINGVHFDEENNRIIIH